MLHKTIVRMILFVSIVTSSSAFAFDAEGSVQCSQSVSRGEGVAEIPFPSMPFSIFAKLLVDSSAFGKHLNAVVQQACERAKDSVLPFVGGSDDASECGGFSTTSVQWSFAYAIAMTGTLDVNIGEELREAFPHAPKQVGVDGELIHGSIEDGGQINVEQRKDPLLVALALDALISEAGDLLPDDLRNALISPFGVLKAGELAGKFVARCSATAEILECAEYQTCTEGVEEAFLMDI